MPEYTRIRRQVGWAMVAMGTATLVYMIAAHDRGWPSLSLLNLLTLIAGSALLVGRLSTVQKMTWCVALYLTVAIGVGVATPVVEPWALIKAQYSAEPIVHGVRHAYQLILVSFLVWAYWRLRSRGVVEAMRERGIRATRPWVAFGLGAFLVLGWVLLEYRFTYSDRALSARTHARLLHGPERAYEVVEFAGDSDHGNATLEAYGPEGSERVTVRWGRCQSRQPALTPEAASYVCGENDQ